MSLAISITWAELQLSACDTIKLEHVQGVLASVPVIDIANYLGELTPELIASIQANNIVGVIVRGSLESPELTSLAQRQIAALQAANIPFHVYAWLYGNADSVAMADATVAAFPGALWYWCDVEDVGSFAGVAPDDAALSVEEALDEFFYAKGVNTGVYTAEWAWSEITGNSTACSSSPLWVANYDDVADLCANWRPFGGWWRTPVGKQYSDTSPVGAPIDSNVFESWFWTSPDTSKKTETAMRARQQLRKKK